MNKIYRVVWSRALRQLVVTSEIAQAPRGGNTSTAGVRGLVRGLIFAGLVLAGAVSGVHAADAGSVINNASFEDGTLTGWTTSTTGSQASGSYGSEGVGASVVTGMTDFDSKFGDGSGPHSWTVTPYGTYMASLQAGGADTFASGATVLGLSSDSQSAIGAFLSGSPTDASWMYQDLVLNAGDSFTMAWQYVSTDYEPWNDSSFTSLVNTGDSSVLATVNNHVAQYAVLGATNAGTGDYSTGSYGATGWEVATYTVSTAGTYRLGFLSFNLNDSANSPVLLIDQQPGLTYDKGILFDPIAPNEGSGAPTTPPSSVTITSPTTTTDLGSTAGAFDGGTLVADGDTTLDQNFTIDNNGGTIDQAGHEVTVNGAITDADVGDAGSLTITNSGNGGGVSLSGTNTYTGTTTIDDGATLSLTGDGSIADSAGVTSNGTFDISGANGNIDITTLDGSGNVTLGGNDLNLTDASGTFGGVIDGSGGLNITGAETLTGGNTYTGTTTIDSNGTLVLAGDGSIADSSGVVDDGTLDISTHTGDVDIVSLDGTGAVELGANGLNLTDASGTFGGSINGLGGVTVQGGTQVLTGANTYGGGTTIEGGTLEIGSDGSLGAPGTSVTFNDGTLRLDGNVDLARNLVLDGQGTIDNGAGDLATVDGAVSGSGELVKDGDGLLSVTGDMSQDGGVTVNGGLLDLQGNNSYAGDTTVNGGTLEIHDDANLGAATGNLALNGGGVLVDGTVDSTRDIILGGDTFIDIDADGSFGTSGDVGGTGTLYKYGDGTLTLDGTLSQAGGLQLNGGTTVLSGDNTYTGATQVFDGTLQIDSDSNLGDPANTLALQDSTLHTTGDVEGSRLIGLGGTATFEVDGDTTMNQSGQVVGSGTLVKDGAGVADFSGALSHTGGTVVNDGTLILGGANTYTGGTTINGGTLQIGDDVNLGDASGGLTFNGGTLHTTDDVGTGRDIALLGDGTIRTDAGTTMSSTGNVSGSGALIKDGTGALELDGTLSHTGGTVVNDGTLVLGGTNTYTGGTTLNGGMLQIDSDANLGDASSGLSFDGGTLRTTASLSTDRDISLAGDGHFDVDAGTTLTATDAIDGNGRLVKQGDGTLVLTGANTYSGGTTVEAGTLQGDSSSLQGDIVDNGTLDFTQDVDGTFAGDISGTGVVRKEGDGTFTLAGTLSQSGGLLLSGGTTVLSGDNTYLGGTQVLNGIVQIDRDSNLGDAGGALVLVNSALHTTGDVEGDRAIGLAGVSGFIVDAGTTMTQAGAVSGSGALVKVGEGVADFSGTLSHGGGTLVEEGTLILGGDNTYTGGTTVDGGTLQVSRDANLGDASSDLTLDGGTLHTTGSFESHRDITLGGGSFATDGGTTFTSDGAIAGTGGLVKNGGGTMVVNGAAAHQGGTTVNAGVLILNGANTYTGGTTLNGGSLQVSRDANLGDLSNAIAFNGGDLTITQSMASDRDMLIGAGNASITTMAGVTFTANGDMSGSGGLVKRGGGTLVVSGNNTFSGGTLIDGGVIKIDSGSSLGTGVILLHGGTLQTVESLGTGQTVLVSGNSGVNVDAGKTAELSGQILTDGSAGCFVKSGKGTLNMTGSATLSNGTCVQEGMLRANGELTSQVQVDRPGTVRGVGVIHGDVNVEGTLAPGNSPGTLSVTGNVSMHAGSTMEIDIDGHGTGTGKGNYSRLLVGGSFVAEGTLAPTLRGITGNASNAFTPGLGDVYTVVEAAGGVQGTFDALQQPTAGLADNTRFQVFYVGGHAVELFVTPSSYATLLDGQANGNAVRVGGAVDRMVAAQDAGTDSADQHGLLFALAGLRAAQLPQVMQDLAGETHVQMAAMAREAGLGLAGDVAQHLAESPLDQGEHGDRAWATLSQGGYRALSDAQAAGFQSQQSRASVGLDAYRGDAMQWGVGLAHTEARLENVPASGNVRGNGALLYGELAAGAALLDGSASWSKDRWSTRRADALAPASSLSSQADGHSMVASVTARFPLQHQGMHVEPYVQATWQRVDRDGFAETGDALTRLTVGRYDANGTRLLAGLNLGSAAQDPLAAGTTWRVGAAVGRDFGDTLDPVVDASLAGESFQLQSPSMGRTLLKLDASGTLRLGKQSYLYGGLNSATADNRASYGVNVGVRVQF